MVFDPIQNRVTTREAALEAFAKEAARKDVGPSTTTQPEWFWRDRLFWLREAADKALSTPATEPQGYVEGLERATKHDAACGWTLAPAVIGAIRKEAGEWADEADLEAVEVIALAVESRILAARPAPQSAADTRVVTVAQLERWESAIYDMGYAVNSSMCDGVEGEIHAIIGTATPAQSDKIAEALAKQTSGGERQKYSGFGHMLFEASWHVHLAGFRSRDEAESALRALTGKVV